MACFSSSTQKDLGYMYFHFHYKYFSFLTCTTWGMWVNVTKCFGIRMPSFNHTLLHFDRTEAPHCGKKKTHWVQHVTKYVKFTILMKICVPQICTFLCCFIYLYVSSVSVLSIVMQWFHCSCTMSSLSNCLPCILQRTRHIQV